MNPTTIFLYQLIGPILAILAISFAFHTDLYIKYYKEFKKTAHFIILGAMMTLAMGMAMVLTHNLWGNPAEILMSIFGWLVLWKGICIAICPNSLIKLTKFFAEKNKMRFMSFLYLALGVIFIWIGYFA